MGYLKKIWFKEIRLFITKVSILAYYNPQKKIVLQCHASNKGLGATLLQDRKSLAHKSRSLIDAGTRYATIEKEMSAIIWGLEQFHQYTYGRSVLVKSEDKSLKAVVTKPLNNALKRLQNMLLCFKHWKPAYYQEEEEHVNMFDYLRIGTEKKEKKLNWTKWS